MRSRLRHASSPRISFFAFQDIITSVSGILILVVLMLAANLEEMTTTRSSDTSPELQSRLTELLAAQTQVNQELIELREQLSEVRVISDVAKLRAEVDLQKTKLRLAKERVDEFQVEADAREAAIREQDIRLGLAGLRARLDKLKQEGAVLKEKQRTAVAVMQKVESQLKEAQSKLLLVKSREGQIWLIPDKGTGSKEPMLVFVSGAGLEFKRFDKPAETVSFDKQSSLAGVQQQIAKFNKANQYFVFLIRPSGIDLFEEISEQVRTASYDVGFDAIDESQIIHFTKPSDADWTTPPPSSPKAPKQAVEGSPAPTTPSKPPPPPTPKPAISPESWWQRFLRAIGLKS